MALQGRVSPGRADPTGAPHGAEGRLHSTGESCWRGCTPRRCIWSFSGMHFAPPPLSCNKDEQRAHPPLLHSRVRNGTGANFPSNASGHMETKEKQRRKTREHREDPTNERARNGQGEGAQGTSPCQTPANTATRSHLDEAPGKTS